MTPEQTVIGAFVSTHPRDAARLVARMSSDRAGQVLTLLPSDIAAQLVPHLDALFAAQTISSVDAELGAKVLDELPLRLAASTLRRIPSDKREELLGQTSSERQGRLRALLAHPVGSAGSLMDPEVLALNEDLLVEDALTAVRAHAAVSFHYVYVVDAGVLKGALGLPELLAASPSRTLASLCRSGVESLLVGTQLDAIASHSAWSRLVALPVVDAEGTLLGVLRYSTLRRIEQELRTVAASQAPGATGEALAELYGLAVAGVLEWPSLLFSGPRSRS